MKNIFLFSILMLAFVSIANAQTAKGGCTMVTVTSTPAYNTNLYFASVSWSSCGNANEPCCRVIFSGSPVAARYFLEKKNSNGSWTQVAGPQSSPNLTEPGVLSPHGTYRVRMNLPVIDYNACEGGEGLPCYNVWGQFIGYWGKWGPNLYTNEVIIGKTVASDNVYEFLDAGGGNNNDLAFDYLETVFINTSESKNYNQWTLNIFEQGGLERYNTTDWQNGQVGNNGILNLTTVWRDGHSNWNFDPLMSYLVTFVVENKDCKNTQDWNDNNQAFFVCPFGSGCRMNSGIPEETAIAPNPVTNALRLSHFTPEEDKDYQLIIRDITGKVVKDIPSWQNEDTDVSDLSQGMYILNLTSNGKPLFSSKFVVNR